MTATLTSAAFQGSPMQTKDVSSSVYEGLRPRQVLVRMQPEGRAPIWLSYVLRRLNELSDRLDDPIRDPAPLPDPAALERALTDLCSALGDDTPAPSVVPTADGGVQFVWHHAGWDIEIEVLHDRTEVWGRNRARSQQWFGDLDEVRDELEAALTEIESTSLPSRD